MRYEDWIFRETEVRLSEHRELREAVGLERIPDCTTLYQFLRRLEEEETITRVLREVVSRLPPLPGGTTVAVDGTGLASEAISTFFVKRARDRGEGSLWRHYLKWLIAVDVPRRAILSQVAKRGSANDSATLRPLVDAAAPVAPIAIVLADAEFDRELNHRHIRRVLRARSVIPAKRGKATWHLRGIRAQMRARFPRSACRQRTLVESVFSSVKRQLSAPAPGRSWTTQRLQALLLDLAYNLYRLKPCLHERLCAFRFTTAMA